MCCSSQKLNYGILNGSIRKVIHFKKSFYLSFIYYFYIILGNGLPSNILEVIDECSDMIYPNISSLLHILAS